MSCPQARAWGRTDRPAGPPKQTFGWIIERCKTDVDYLASLLLALADFALLGVGLRVKEMEVDVNDMIQHVATMLAARDGRQG